MPLYYYCRVQFFAIAAAAPPRLALLGRTHCVQHFQLACICNYFSPSACWQSKHANSLLLRVCPLPTWTHSAPCILNLDQKLHGLSCFRSIDTHETFQNQKWKTSVIPSVNMARKCHQRASFSTENLFFEHQSFGSLMTDIFLDWFWTLLDIWKPQKQESPWNFRSRLKMPGAHCEM